METKKIISQAQREAQKRYYEKIKNSESYIEARKNNMKKYHDKNKDSEDYKEMKREKARQYYNLNRDRVISRIMCNYINKRNLNSDSSETSED